MSTLQDHPAGRWLLADLAALRDVQARVETADRYQPHEVSSALYTGLTHLQTARLWLELAVRRSEELAALRSFETLPRD